MPRKASIKKVTRDRATKFTPKAREKFLELIEQGYPNRLASKKVGVSYTTYCEHIKVYPEFRERVEEARLRSNEQWVLEAENDLKQHSKDNFKATEMILCNRAPDRWHEVRGKSIIHNNNFNQQANTDVKLEGQVTEDFIQALLTLDVLEEKQRNGQLIEQQPETKGE